MDPTLILFGLGVGVLVGMTFMVEIGALGGRALLPAGVPVHAILSY